MILLLVNFVIIITNRYWNYYIPIILLLYIHVDIIVGTFLKFILHTRTHTYTNTQLLSSKNKQDPGTKTPSPIWSASLGHYPIPNPVSIFESEDGSKAYRRIPIKFSNPTRLLTPTTKVSCPYFTFYSLFILLFLFLLLGCSVPANENWKLKIEFHFS